MTLSAEQLALRAGGMGSSDVAMLVTGSPISVWCRKTGRDATRPTEAMDLGHDVEPAILRAFSRRVKPCSTWGETLVHPTLGWAMATPDGRTGDGEIVEAKLVGGHRAHQWDDGPPDYPVVQVTWQMGVTRLRVAWIAALIGSTDFRWFRIEFDGELWTMLVERARDFWTCNVLGDVQPEVDGSSDWGEYLARRFPRSSDAMLDADEGLDAVARELTTVREALAPLESRERELENRLRLAIGERAGVQGRDWRATWRGGGSGTVAWKSVAEELAAGTVPEDIRQKHTSAPSRRFTFTAKK